MKLKQLLLHFKIISKPDSPLHSTSDLLHLDKPLLCGLLILAGFGLIVLYSAEGQNLKKVKYR